MDLTNVLKTWHDWLFNAVLLFAMVTVLVSLLLRKGLRQRPKFLMLVLCALLGAEFARDFISSRGDLSTYLSGIAFLGIVIVAWCLRAGGPVIGGKEQP